MNIIIYKNDPDAALKKEIIKEAKTKKEYELTKKKFGLPSAKTYLLEYMADYISTCELKSIKKYKFALRRLDLFLPKDILIRDFNTKQFQAFADHLYSDMSAHGANSYLKSLKKILNMAVSEGIITESPAKGVRLNKVSRDFTREILLIDEVVMLWRDVGNDVIKKAFIFACYTGIGFAEAKTLTSDNVRDGMLIYKRAKNDVIVRVPLREDVKSLIRGDGLLFPDLPSHSYCTRALKVWTQSHGITKNITFYCARHSFAVNLIMAGVDIESVRSYMGHLSYAHTMGYVRYVSSLQDNKIDKLKGL